MSEWGFTIPQDPDFDPPPVPPSFDVWYDDAEQALPFEEEEDADIFAVVHTPPPPTFEPMFEDLPDEAAEEAIFARQRVPRRPDSVRPMDDEEFLEKTSVKVTKDAIVSIVGYPFDDDLVFFLRQSGVVVGYVPSLDFAYDFMDISDQLNKDLPRDGRVDSKKVGLRKGYEERGLLSMAFEPVHKSRRVFFTFTTGADHGLIHQNRTDIDHLLVLASTSFKWVEMTPSNTDMPIRVPVAIEKSLHQIPHWLELPHPSRIHIGGHILFDPTSLLRPVLFMATGDGGRWEDESYAVNAQDHIHSLLGAILRLDVGSSTKQAIKATQKGVVAYGIPKTNPYAKGQKGYRPEIWVKGLRNCSGFTIHPSVYNELETLNRRADVRAEDYTDLERHVQLTIAHVGGREVEAIQTASAGQNLGWPIFEGGFMRLTQGEMDPVKPSIAYAHPKGDGFGTAVMGGCFYEKTTDHYLFGDFGINRATDETSDFKGSVMVTRLTEADREDDVRVRTSAVRTVSLRGYVKAIGSTFDGKRIFLSMATHMERARGTCRIYEVRDPAVATGYGC